MSSLLLGKSTEVDYEQLQMLPVVPATESYCPVEHWKLIDSIRKCAFGVGLNAIKLRAGIQDSTLKEVLIPGAKMFAMMDIEAPEEASGDDINLSIGIRNSYDRSMSVGICVGASVMVCDNMMLTGEMVVARKHTTNVWQDIIPMITAILSVATRQHELDQVMRDEFKHHPISESAGLDLLGKMAAHGHISYTGGSKSAFSTAINEWREPTFEEFVDRNIWSLYNACTYGTKRSTLGNIVNDNAKVTLFFRDNITPHLSRESAFISNDMRATRAQLVA